MFVLLGLAERWRGRFASVDDVRPRPDVLLPAAHSGDSRAPRCSCRWSARDRSTPGCSGIIRWRRRRCRRATRGVWGCSISCSWCAWLVLYFPCRWFARVRATEGGVAQSISERARRPHAPMWPPGARRRSAWAACGCRPSRDRDDERSIAVLHAAFDAGVTLLDTVGCLLPRR